MQIHSAIILLVGGEFAGFFTFQVNKTVGEFCLLQSVIRPDVYTPELYRAMAQAVIDQNTDGLPMTLSSGYATNLFGASSRSTLAPPFPPAAAVFGCFFFPRMSITLDS